MSPNVLSIAGSDPSGGAGLQADLKTFAALGCHGMAVVTALTVQNTIEVRAVHLPPAAFVAAQMMAIFDDIEVAAVKIGMLGSQETVEAVAEILASKRGMPIVVDPVLAASSGRPFGDDRVIAAMRADLFPLATLVTPNLEEAARLAGIDPLASRADIEAAAHALRGDHPTAWLVKGGHGGGAQSEDLLLDQSGPLWLSAPRVATGNTHGTGCTLSSAIAAALAQGRDLRTAVASAKAYLSEALAGADRLSVGRGPGPVDHFARWQR